MRGCCRQGKREGRGLDQTEGGSETKYGKIIEDKAVVLNMPQISVTVCFICFIWFETHLAVLRLSSFFYTQESPDGA